MKGRKQRAHPRNDRRPGRPASTGQTGDSAGRLDTHGRENAEHYREVIRHYRWTLGILVVVLLGFVGYAMFKNLKEYEGAVTEAREAAREARAWEARAQGTFATIDETVKQKLVEIEGKGEEITSNLLQEVGRHRELMELWAQFAFLQGGLAGPHQFEYTIGLLERILEVDPNSNAALQFLPTYHLLLAWQDTPRRTQWAHKVVELCERGDALGPANQAAFLACAYALLGDEEECKRHAQIAVEEGGSQTLGETLPGQILREKYGKTSWFKEICSAEKTTEMPAP